MKKICLMKFLTVALILLCCVPAFSEVLTEDAIRVKIEVIGDWRINREVEEYLSTYLDSMTDVEVVEEEPKIYIHVIARGINTNKGRRLGYVMASASSEIMEMLVDGNYPYVITDYNGLWMETGPDLKILCQQCAVAIDAGVLAKLRKTPVE